MDGKKILKSVLIFNLCMVFMMILIGGLTRLTGSGLSIVEWDLIKGILPPLNDTEWSSLFEAYRQSPEFRLLNFDFMLQDFKNIFWLEYIHRLLGRMLGLCYILPLVLGCVYRKTLISFLPKFFLLFFLVAAQGIMGWLMVKSGLVNEAQVSHYRLAAHLILALMLYTATLLVYAHIFLSSPEDSSLLLKQNRRFLALLVLTFLTMTYGALVAGLKAGLIYNTFPLMNDHFLPEELFALDPFLRNFVDNHGTVQFIHRMLGLSTLSYLVFVTYKAYAYPAFKTLRPRLLSLTLVIGFLQVSLGILTLLYGVALIPALLHQACAVFLTTGVTLLYHQSASSSPKFLREAASL